MDINLSESITSQHHPVVSGVVASTDTSYVEQQYIQVTTNGSGTNGTITAAAPPSPEQCFWVSSFCIQGSQIFSTYLIVGEMMFWSPFIMKIPKKKLECTFK